MAEPEKGAEISANIMLAGALDQLIQMQRQLAQSRYARAMLKADMLRMLAALLQSESISPKGVSMIQNFVSNIDEHDGAPHA